MRAAQEVSLKQRQFAEPIFIGLPLTAFTHDPIDHYLTSIEVREFLKWTERLTA